MVTLHEGVEVAQGTRESGSLRGGAASGMDVGAVVMPCLNAIGVHMFRAGDQLLELEIMGGGGLAAAQI